MTELLAGQIPVEALQRVLSELPWPHDAILLAFAPERFWFAPLHDQVESMEPTEQGRVFSPQGELKWRQLESDLQVVYLGSDGPKDWLTDESDELTGLQPLWRDVYLWGERTDLEQEWIEQQVPHRFQYPVTSQLYPRGRIQVRLEEWCNAAGLPCFVRYHSLQEVKGE